MAEQKNRRICKPRQGQRLLTTEQDAWLRENYRHLSRAEITSALNARFGLALEVKQVITYTRNHKISSGRTGHFEKGHSAWNDGVRGFMGANSGSFKPGSVPRNHRPIGAERIDTADGYLLVKTAEINPHTGYIGYWRPKHLVIWEQLHGPVPTGMLVTFANGDKTDLRIDNLEMISRAENAMRNKLRYQQLPDNIKPLAATLTQVYLKSGQRRRELKPC